MRKVVTKENYKEFNFKLCGKFESMHVAQVIDVLEDALVVVDAELKAHKVPVEDINHFGKYVNLGNVVDALDMSLVYLRLSSMGHQFITKDEFEVMQAA